MANQIKSDQMQYALGYSAIQTKMLAKRSFETHCQFLQPYLRKGMTILDCGCGPGTVTIGLARIVAPATVVAIDISEEQLNIAYENTKKAGINNIEFKQASTLNLPFEDNTFDLVFSHAVLLHLQHPTLALIEQKRVVKDGGIVATRDPYNGSQYFIYPRNKLVVDALTLFYRSITDQGGDIDLGIKLAELFHAAGLKEIQHSLVCENYGAAKAAEFYSQIIIEGAYYKKLLANHEVTLKQLKEYQQAWVDFSKTPGAYYGFIWGEAIGVK